MREFKSKICTSPGGVDEFLEDNHERGWSFLSLTSWHVSGTANPRHMVTLYRDEPEKEPYYHAIKKRDPYAPLPNTLCGAEGFVSIDVTCPDCLRILSEGT